MTFTNSISILWKHKTAAASIAVLLSVILVSFLFAGAAAATITDTTADGPEQAMAGDTVTVTIAVSADSPDISAIQINPDENPDHVNEFAADEIIDAGANTQIAEDGLIAYSELQEEVTVTWEFTVPEDADVGDTVTVTGDALDSDQDGSQFSHTVEVADAAITDATLTGPNEVSPGDTVDLSLQTAADAEIINAVQINPDEEPNHVNEFANLGVTDAGADTQVSEELIAYTEPQSSVTVSFEATVPGTATVDETITVTGDVIATDQNRQSFTHTVAVTDPVDKYRNDQGNVDDLGLLDGIDDWRAGDLGDLELLEVIDEWRE